MKRLLKTACLLLSVLLLCTGLLTACQKDTPDDETSKEASAPAEVSKDPFKDENGYVAKTSGETYGGRTVTFLICSVNPTYNSELLSNVSNPYVDEASPLPDVIDKAQGDRIQKVEATLDIKITEEVVFDGKRKNGEMLQRIRLDALSFCTDYQFVVPCMYDGATLASEGALIDLFTLPGIQMDAPWWDQEFIKEMAVADQLYIAIGDIGTVNKSATSSILFNKVLYKQYGLDAKYGGTPYDFVRNGTWTLDLALSLAKELSADLDGEEGINYKDMYSWGGELGDVSKLFYGANCRIASTDTADGYPELTMYSARSNTVMEKIQSLVQDKTHFVCADDYFSVVKWPGELILKNFSDGKSLIYSGSLSTPISLGEMADDFGMVPVPKGDEMQEGYHNMIGAWTATCFAVPSYLPEEDRQLVSDVLNVMGAESANILAPAYLHQCIEYMKSRDDDTVDMIENYILPGRGCDIGAVFEWGGLNSMFYTMATQPIGSFASNFDSRRESAQQAMDTTIGYFRSLKEKA